MEVNGKDDDDTVKSNDTNEGIEFHGEKYHIIPGDLRNIDVVEKQLIKCGIDFNIPTLFLSECVLIYMRHEHSNKVIEFAGTKFPTSVFVTYEQILPNTRFGSVKYGIFCWFWYTIDCIDIFLSKFFRKCCFLCIVLSMACYCCMCKL